MMTWGVRLIYLQHNKKACSPHGEHTLKIWYGKYQLHDHFKHLANLQLLLIRSVVCDVQRVVGLDVGLFWWYRRKMALEIIGFRQILICRKSGLQVKHLAFL